MNTFEWTASESAESNYPVYLVKGDLVLADDTPFYVPDKRLVQSGWGIGGSHHIVGSKLKTLPKKATLEWFSFRENKFYVADINLPMETLNFLFKTGYKRESNPELKKFNKIIFGVGLGGNISIWVSGSDFSMEVSRFLAQESAGNWSKVVKNPKINRIEFINDIVSDATEKDDRHQIDAAEAAFIWKGYQHQYSWEPVVLGSIELLDLFIQYRNGEKGYFDTQLGDGSKYYFRSTPKRMYLDYKTSDGKKYNSEIIFSNEIVEAFEKLHEQNPDDKLRLKIEIHEKSRSIAVYLQNHQFTMRLEDFDVKTGRYHSGE